MKRLCQNRFKGDIARDEERLMRFFDLAFATYRRELANPIFVVASDDRQWCEKAFDKHDDVVITNKNSALFDFALLASCNHSIYDYGSFGFWTSVLAGGKTILAKGWSNITHPLLRAIEKYPPPNWRLFDLPEARDGTEDRVTSLLRQHGLY